MSSTKIFISHAAEGKFLAGQIKGYLLYNFGLDVFVAHDDIKPLSDWREELLKGMKESNVIIILLTKDCRESEWVDQESGMGVILGHKIIPISVDGTTPHGFINKYQAFKWSGEFDAGMSRLITLMTRQGLITIDNFIDKLDRTTDFHDAKRNLKTIMNMEDDGVKLDQKQVNRIVDITKHNYAVSNSFSAESLIAEFIKKHKKDIE
ncbi:MAG: toll/interleukin-1 receptor domain-containing protein [Candidatus Micrarchaeota archaeon]|nr:toll/interleukin-1 receptor domain-containing protein [Candidatus Micrarchaeota archaeon]MDE1851607.1 toll/interleukin-1 receptor domain-containing protein [Candidatus Micrarchaeota archaeon]